MAFTQKQRYNMQDLLDIVALLRDPDHGCPWDKVQTHASIRKNFIEETYEVADAIDQADAHLLCEELGDVLLQVALHTRMEEETGAFTFEDVCTGICEKLVYRHPHIFGTVRADDEGTVLKNWEELKREEKARQSLADDLASVPAALPALMRAQKVLKRAGARGIGPASTDEAQALLDKAVDALGKAPGEEALGRVLLAACAVAQLSGQDAEQALTRAAGDFARDAVERQD